MQVKTLEQSVERAKQLKAEDGRRRLVVHNERNLEFGFDPYCITTDGTGLVRALGSKVVFDTDNENS
jgi:hypothetical protein